MPQSCVKKCCLKESSIYQQKHNGLPTDPNTTTNFDCSLLKSCCRKREMLLKPTRYRILSEGVVNRPNQEVIEANTTRNRGRVRLPNKSKDIALRESFEWDEVQQIVQLEDGCSLRYDDGLLQQSTQKKEGRRLATQPARAEESAVKWLAESQKAPVLQARRKKPVRNLKLVIEKNHEFYRLKERLSQIKLFRSAGECSTSEYVNRQKCRYLLARMRVITQNG